MPDANSIWTFREALTRAQIGGVPAIEALFRRFDVMLSVAGYITIGGQIVDATVVAAPKQRNTEDEKGALKEGRIPEAWAQLPGLLDKVNTGSSVWADTAYRSAKNEAYLEINGFRSRIHRKKPQAKPMPKHVSRANAAKSEVRAHVEHVFAGQKGPMALVIRTIGLARARVKIGLANLAYNMCRMVWLGSRPLPVLSMADKAGAAPTTSAHQY